MKKIALAVTLIVGLIFWVTFSCAVVGAQVQQASDSLQDYYDRYKPKMTPPTISIASPQNYSVINTDSISLVFNVSEPQVIEMSPDANKVSTRLFRVSYRGDWQTEEHFLYSAEHGSLDFLEFNATLLNIPDGTHQLQVIAEGVVGFTVAMFGFSYHSETNTSIIFTVNSTQPTPSSTFTSTPEPFPTLPLIASSIAIAVVAVALVICFKKVHRKQNPKKAASALILILFLLAAALTAATPQVHAVSYPSEPVTDPPEIIVYSPSNTTYYERNIWVNFTIIQPTSWHQDNFSLVSIQQVSYQLDDPVPEHVGFPNLTNNQYLALLKELPDGKHTLQIDVLRIVNYKQRENWIFTETYAMNTRLTINFTVNAEPTPSPSASPSTTPSPSPLPNQKEPFPTTLVIAISATIAIITLSAIVYLKKRRH